MTNSELGVVGMSWEGVMRAWGVFLEIGDPFFDARLNAGGWGLFRVAWVVGVLTHPCSWISIKY